MPENESLPEYPRTYKKNMVNDPFKLEKIHTLYQKFNNKDFFKRNRKSGGVKDLSQPNKKYS